MNKTAVFIEFFVVWLHPPSADYRLRIDLAHRIKRGTSVTAAFLYNNCKSKPDDNCNVDVDLRAIDPNGIVVGKAPNLVPQNEKVLPKGAFYLGKSHLAISLGGSPGVRRTQALARDNIAGSRAPLVQTVEVVG
ncbi:hypothetical protein [Azotobacter salinestris]|uniref:hypothetical protein n=1 Tax=Azotobacter salinestris TaxID=69964 RepID=UPI0032DFE90B